MDNSEFPHDLISAGIYRHDFQFGSFLDDWRSRLDLHRQRRSGQDAGNDADVPASTANTEQSETTPQDGAPDADPPLEIAEPPSVAELLQQLDSQKFAQRESATEQLIERGEAAIRPAAIHFFEGLPEPNWRIKRVLETISTTGDEAVFLKTAVILRLLYANQNPDIEQQISQLQMEWRLSRRNKAIGDLTRSGLEIESFNNRDLVQMQLMMNDNAAARRALNVRRFGIPQLQTIESNTRSTDVDGDSDEDLAVLRHEDPLADPQASIQKIENVLGNPVEKTASCWASLNRQHESSAPSANHHRRSAYLTCRQ